MAEMSIVEGLRGLVLVGFLDLVADGIGKLFDNLCLLVRKLKLQDSNMLYNSPFHELRIQ